MSGAVSAAWRPEPDRATAWIDVTVPATPEAVAAIVQDPRGTGLAGELIAFTSAERSPEQRHTRYAVAMPWPLRPRRFAITSTRHPCAGGLWLLNRSDPEDAAPWSVDGVDGVLYCSDYRLRAVSGGCRIERILSIDLKLPDARPVDRQAAGSGDARRRAALRQGRRRGGLSVRTRGGALRRRPAPGAPPHPCGAGQRPGRTSTQVMRS